MPKNTDPNKQSLIHDVSGSYKRHKWSGKAGKERPVGCVKCGCVKEIVSSGVIYFVNDCVYTRAPNCH